MSLEIPTFNKNMDITRLPCDGYSYGVSEILKISTEEIRRGETPEYSNYSDLYRRITAGVDRLNERESFKNVDTIWAQNVLVGDLFSSKKYFEPAIGVFVLGVYDFGIVRLNETDTNMRALNLTTIPSVTEENDGFPTCYKVRPIHYYNRRFQEQQARENVLMKVFDLLQEGVDAEDFLIYKRPKAQEV